MRTTEERLDELERIIKQKEFRENKGLGNEVGYYVFDYPADKELIVRDRVMQMLKKNEKGLQDFKLVALDLYDIILDLLLEKGYLDHCFEIEKNDGLGLLVKSIGDLLQIHNEDNLILRHIKKNISEDTVLLLTGVGKCFPILRSHKVLNILHQVLDNIPVVMLYPGEYDGLELKLFSKLEGDNYYRAFKIVSRKESLPCL